MVSVDISLTPSLPGVTLPLSLSLNKRILGDFMGLCFSGRIRSNRKEGVTRIPESTHGRRGALPLERYEAFVLWLTNIRVCAGELGAFDAHLCVGSACAGEA